MKISETKSSREFALVVSEKELQWIHRALCNDHTNYDENGALFAEVDEFMDDNDVDGI